MKIKSTINIKISQVEKINSIAKEFNITKSWIINSLIKMVIKNNNYKIKFLSSVQYQKKIQNSNDTWHCLPVSFQNDIYEKCFDMKKLFKFSSSFIISDAIDKYLDQLIINLKQDLDSDNYSSTYILFYTKSEYQHKFTLLWDIIPEETLIKQMEIHNIT